MRERGTAAERLARDFLQRQGLIFETANYRCRHGEIDLIFRDGATLVFVEVRLRRRGEFGGAAGSITRDKQLRIIAAAQHYLARHGAPPPCRFDVVLLGALEPGKLEWIKNAFDSA